jgi:hypothetical protein
MRTCQIAVGQDEELWQKLDAQIRQTHTNLERLIGAKIRIELKLSRDREDHAYDPHQNKPPAEKGGCHHHTD